MRDLNKFKGCLIGGAVGDALGYAVEFLPAISIFQKYGENGITEYELHHGAAEISDDTQMTLFTATGLLVGTTRGMTRGIMGDYAECYIAYSYRDWYRTQTEKYPLPEEYHYSWLVNVSEMFNRRAPGNTCLSALAQGGNGALENPLNHSKGCGGIMRVAPIGLYFCDKRYQPEEIDIIGAKAAALTHGHELGYIPAAMLVHIILRISEYGDTILEATKDAMCMMPVIFPNAKHMNELLTLIQKAIALSEENTDDLNAIRQLGEGWVAEETLAIAVYCALKYSDDFEKGIIAAVNHDGDSDSTGAVAGNILGVALGFDAIPQKYLDNLELKDIILEIADDLHRDCQVTEYGPRDNLWESKYIKMAYKKDENTASYRVEKKMKFISWNVNGLRARVDHGDFLEFCKEFSPDFICLQEIKMTPWQKRFDLGDVYEYWNPCMTKGISGTAVFSKKKAMSMVLDRGVDLNDDDGRIIALEYPDFYLVTVYVPTGTGGKRTEAIQKKLAWLADFVEYIKGLNQKKPVILCGDMNIAHSEIDLSHPDPKSAGFTDKERAAITDILESGFCDSFRYLHPNAENQYTWVSNKFKTGGLRLDYFFVSDVFKLKIIKADILREKTLIDHCPILLELDM